MVQEALNRIMINRTTFIVSHRLTTFINADMIVVIQRGFIVKMGKILQCFNIFTFLNSEYMNKLVYIHLILIFN